MAGIQRNPIDRIPFQRCIFHDLDAGGQVKRHGIYVRMQEIMEETGAYVWIKHEPEAFGHSGDVAGRPGASALPGRWR